MSHDEFALSGRSINELFPFGFQVGPGGLVEALGEGLRRRLNDVTAHGADELFEVVLPRGVERIERALELGPCLVVLRLRESGLELRGQLVPGRSARSYAFLGVPGVRSFDDLREHRIARVTAG